jgi:hypothetical protein
MSEYKQVLGCKGIGRFIYLTICDKVEFESYNRDKNIKFDFDLDTEEIRPTIIEDKELIKKTTLKFINIHSRYITSDLNTEAKEITNHFLSIFKFIVDSNKNVAIKLYVDNILKETIHANEYGSGFIDEDMTIKIGDNEENFKISYKQKRRSIKGFYCADNRQCKTR